MLKFVPQRLSFKHPHSSPTKFPIFSRTNFRSVSFEAQRKRTFPILAPSSTLPFSSRIFRMASTKTYPNLLRFDLNAEDIPRLTEDIKRNTKQRLDDIAKIPAQERTFANTVAALADVEGNFATSSSSCNFPANVSTIKEVRDASSAAQQSLSSFMIEMDSREDLYNALLEYKRNRPEEVASLQAEDRRLLDKLIESFERNGLALPPEQRQRVKEIKTKISDLCIKFQQNLNEDVTKLEFTREELDGMPEDYLQELGKVPDSDKFYVSLKYPELFPFMEKNKVESSRKRLEFAKSAQCMKENTPILEEIIQLRQEEAKLLNFPTHADYVLAVRMAKNADTVFKFLRDLTAKLDDPAKRERAKLLEMKKKDCEGRGIPFDGNLNLWDWRYYDTQLLQSEYQVDHDVIKEYFPMERVTAGLLEIYQEVLSLRFEEMPKDKIHVWHEDVKQFEVYDKDTNNFLGHFYLDLYPRDGKYGHAAEFDLQKGYTRLDGSRQYPAAAMVANFTKPTADKPSLLKFDEVETYFHEFGHVMHELCTTAKYFRFGGTAVETDFVEAPSQMLENWCYDAEILKKLSGHYKDLSKTLPEDLRNKIVKAKNVNEAFKNRRQLHYGTFDIAVHTMSGKVDTAEVWAQCIRDVALTPAQPGTNGAAGFAHITGGYSAGYYGYLWSKVFSCDMFQVFKEKGLLNKEVGKRYRNIILATGGKRDAMDVVKEFLGREPNQDAFLKEIGAI